MLSSGGVAAFIPQLDQQIELALGDARAHGFQPRPMRIVAGADHGPLPYVAGLSRRRARVVPIP